VCLSDQSVYYFVFKARNGNWTRTNCLEGSYAIGIPDGILVAPAPQVWGAVHHTDIRERSACVHHKETVSLWVSPHIIL